MCNLYISLHSDFGVTLLNIASRCVVKRESGENPEQTRCCMLNQNPCAKLTRHFLALARWEGRTKDE